MNDYEKWNTMWNEQQLNASWVIPHADQNLTALDLRSYSSALELGCGHGINSKYLSEHISSVDANDISNFAIDYCKNNIKNVNFIQGDFFEIDFKKKYDLIFDRGFLHSLGDKVKGVEKIASLLTPSGNWVTLIGSTQGLTKENKGPPAYDLSEIIKIIEPLLKITYIEDTFILNKKTILSPAWLIKTRLK